jgi:hypothetical protein
MFVLSCVPWIASGWGILYLILDYKPVSDSKHYSPVEAVLYVTSTVHLIYVCVNTALKFVNNPDKFEQAVNVLVTGVEIIIIAAFVHLKFSNHLKSLSCTGIASVVVNHTCSEVSDGWQLSWRCVFVISIHDCHRHNSNCVDAVEAKPQLNMNLKTFEELKSSSYLLNLSYLTKPRGRIECRCHSDGTAAAEPMSSDSRH